MDYLLVIFASWLFMQHRGLVDLKMYSQTTARTWVKYEYPFLVSDHTYLGGTLIIFLFAMFVAHFASLSLIDFSACVAIGTLIGSQTWDMVFGGILYRNPFHPFFNWYAGWGFDGDIFLRYIFDGCRVGVALALLTYLLIK
jgi:hypothetical protein